MNKKEQQTKKRIVIIGASSLQMPLIEKAKEMGYETHVFAWKVGDPGETAADCFYPVSITEIEQIIEICKKLQPVGVCTIASDLAVIAVSRVADALRLPCNSLEACYVSTNKHAMRLCFEENGDPSVKSRLVKEGETTDLSGYTWPVIVKPTDRSGSRGITLVQDPADLAQAMQTAWEVSFEKACLIEEFAKGQEYSVEVISWQGERHLLAITRKETTGVPHFIETAHQEPSGLSEIMQHKVKNVVFHALDSLGLQNGASHTEIKIDEQENIRIIEAAGRMGGDYIGSHLVHYSTGYDFVKMVIQCAVGEKPILTPDRAPQAVCSVYILNQDDLDIFYLRQKEDPQSILEIPEPPCIELERAVTDSSGRYGCYLFRV